MISRIIRWFQREREWNREHQLAWAGAEQMGPDGLSAFQRECEASLASALGAIGRTITDRSVEGDSEEPMITGRISESEIRFWIYVDGAQVGERCWEKWDAKTPEELRRGLISDALEAVHQPPGPRP